ncbi:hypothetical protein NE237_005988 [Protea cynaroides]|uniref:KNOX1 domain-containing protein n=1 Tax=Protea cynaroides TaxID=273540 RepID=A0A9Q0KLR2_9MAGN|nr:hypothetical protein NE237_005988 [Protea cynaroides]
MTVFFFGFSPNRVRGRDLRPFRSLLGILRGGGSNIAGLNDDAPPMLVSLTFSGEQQRQLKAAISNHPLYEQLLEAHVGCLRVAIPIDHLPLIDGQLEHAHHFLRSYASHHRHHHHNEKQDLDNFLTQYLLLLCSFKEQLQHVRVHLLNTALEMIRLGPNLKDEIVGGVDSRNLKRTKKE